MSETPGATKPAEAATAETNPADALHPASLPKTSRGWMARQPAPLQWGLLLLGSAALGGLLFRAGLPAALLLGPMVVGIVAGVNGATVRVPKLPYAAGQGIIGCLIASSITAGILHTFLGAWPVFLGVVLSTLVASSVLGWLMSRWQVLPGTTAVWGSSPGAATAMMLMAEAFGADARLVAFMQYLRVVFVALAASILARLWVDTSGAHAEAVHWFPPILPVPFAETLALAFGGAWLGQRLRLPAGSLLLPMVLGAALHIAGLIRFELPEWLLAMSYAVLGWRIGLGFTRAVLVHASRALPRIVLSILVLIGFCGALAWGLHHWMGIDPLTAYLATSPGGIDSVAIIAATSGNVDLPFVMALQTVRLFIVMAAGPSLARMIARHGRRDVPAAG
ncbi:AbrB family transcriptional regulator [Roseomonas elaeocarpi]|uniref:AbrB family transcriptional regulator n=1 Tax=Roseomonas elaeocarpi TaxID=907779 RepID=A0ABV6JPX3_9PROT